MAWTLDRAAIGTPLANQAGSATTITLTTNVAVASGTWIYLGISWWTNTGTTISSIADDGPGLTYSTHAINTTNNQRSGLARAYAASGMASGTVITVTFTGGSYQRALAGSSFTGGSGATAHDPATNTGAVNAHSVTVANVVSGDLLFEMNGNNGASSTNTPDANSTETAEIAMAAGPGCAVFSYRIAASSGSLAVGGTWSSASDWASSGAAFTDSGGSSVTATNQLSYDLIEAISAANQLSYDVVNTVTAANQLSYDLIEAITAGNVLSYDVLNAITAGNVLSYDILDAAAPVTAANQLSYDVLNAITAGNVLSYDVLNAIIASNQLSYDVLNAITAGNVLSYDVLNAITDALQLNYDIGEVILAAIPEFVASSRGVVWQPDQFTLGRRR